MSIVGHYNNGSFIGGNEDISGDYNTGNGSYSNTHITGSNNTGNGACSNHHVTGDYNTGSGAKSSEYITGNGNTGIGVCSSRFIIGNWNFAGGYGSGNHVSGYDNIAIGLGAGCGIRASESIAIGNNSKAVTSSVALGANTVADRESTVAVGYRQIAQVEDGTEINDAVTLRQLNELKLRVARLEVAGKPKQELVDVAGILNIIDHIAEQVKYCQPSESIKRLYDLVYNDENDCPEWVAGDVSGIEKAIYAYNNNLSQWLKQLRSKIKIEGGKDDK